LHGVLSLCIQPPHLFRLRYESPHGAAVRHGRTPVLVI
jgi:hypothetical protein